jgi:hypothetical protein
MEEIKQSARDRNRFHKLSSHQEPTAAQLTLCSASKPSSFDASPSNKNEGIGRTTIWRKVQVVQPATCAEYLEAMAAVRRACEEEGTVPLYHYTMLAVAPFILGGGFRMSTQGQGGRGAGVGGGGGSVISLDWCSSPCVESYSIG